MNRRTFALALAVATAAPFASLNAQCVGPDNLTGACWQPAQPNLPQLPPFQIPGLGVCWDQCQPAAKNETRVVWDIPQPSGCAQFVSKVDVFDSNTGAHLMVGKATMDYTRTWDEVAANGDHYQVWRFVVKADFGPAAASTVNPVCPVPSCILPGAHPTAFFYGYVDYAFNCSQGFYEHSLVLHHACDFFIHKPGLSDRPGVFHPGRSYAIVAPHTNAMPFIPMSLPAPGGPLVAEAVRNVGTATGAVGCTTEDRISGGQLVPFVNACMCTLSLIPPQYTLSVLNGKGSCLNAAGNSTNFSSQNISFPTLPWPHLVSASIGCWGNDVRYPGKECAWANEGLFSYNDACPQTAGAYFEVFYGATTTDGWAIAPTPIGPPPTDKFVDLADNFTHKVGGPVILPLFGSVQPTNHLIYVNVP